MNSIMGHTNKEMDHQSGLLIRSKNYLDLNDSAKDNSNYQDDESQLDSSKDSDLSFSAPFDDRQDLVYANVNTQTSFSDNCDDSEKQETIDCQPAIRTDRFRAEANKQVLETLEEQLQEADEEQQQQPIDSNCDIHQREKQHDKESSEQINRLEQQLTILRDLLRIERQKNEQRRINNQSMQQYLAQLQSEYLGLQNELVETLELGHKIKAQKEAQINALDETLKEKDRLIDQLRDNLSNLDESKVRDEFKELMDKQNKLAQLEKEQLKEQIENVEQQLIRERVNNSQILQQFQTKLDEQMRAHEDESAKLRRKLSSLETEHEKLLNEPGNLIIKNLREEKSLLSCQVEELNLVLNESQNKYESLRKRIECLLSEHEQIELKNQEEIERLQQYYADQRRSYNEMKSMLEDRDEVVQIVQFNLQRSEKRVKNLLNALKGKEQTYKEIISQLNTKHEEELDKLTGELRSLERKLVDNQSELDKKQNEIIKLELERDNKLDSLRNDRDERLMKHNQERMKLEKELKAMELKFAREFEDKEHKVKLIEQYQKEMQYFKEESKRLSIELTKSEAKLFNKQQELKNLIASKERQTIDGESQQQVDSFKLELDEAKRHSKRLADTIGELKTENEKLRMKLKINETNLAKVNATISKEHSKMIHEYETRLEQIKLEQSAFDRNKIKYKRYGYKLKKYCDHLRRVHEHLCNPNVCGYLVIPSCPSSLNSTPNSKQNLDKFAILSSDDEHYSTINLEWMNDMKENATCCLTPTRFKKRHEKFSIKRTGTATATAASLNTTPKSPTIPANNPKQSILKPIGNTRYSQETNRTPDHKYYYINEAAAQKGTIFDDKDSMNCQSKAII